MPSDAKKQAAARKKQAANSKNRKNPPKKNDKDTPTNGTNGVLSPEGKFIFHFLILLRECHFS